MVSGYNGHHSRRHGKDDQELRKIEEEVECLHQGTKEGGRNGKHEETELGRGRQGEGTTRAVDATVHGEYVDLVLAKPNGG
jgi:hypothetical protein